MIYKFNYKTKQCFTQLINKVNEILSNNNDLKKNIYRDIKAKLKFTNYI